MREGRKKKMKTREREKRGRNAMKIERVRRSSVKNSECRNDEREGGMLSEIEQECESVRKK